MADANKDPTGEHVGLPPDEFMGMDYDDAFDAIDVSLRAHPEIPVAYVQTVEKNFNKQYKKAGNPLGAGIRQIQGNGWHATLSIQGGMAVHSIGLPGAKNFPELEMDPRTLAELMEDPAAYVMDQVRFFAQSERDQRRSYLKIVAGFVRRYASSHGNAASSVSGLPALTIEGMGWRVIRKGNAVNFEPVSPSTLQA